MISTIPPRAVPAGVTFVPSPSKGDVGTRMAAKDWSLTPLGARASWSRSLSNVVEMVLDLPTPAIVFWGAEHIQLYNDGYARIMGPRHPTHLGSTFRACWPEAHDAIQPWMQRVLAGGEIVTVDRSMISLARYGYPEEAYFTFSFSPVRDDDGRIAGVLQLVTEVTTAVLSERRSHVLHELARHTTEVRSQADALERAIAVMSSASRDIPSAAIYLADAASPTHLVRAASYGSDAPPELSLEARLLGEMNDERTFVAPIYLGETGTIAAALVTRMSDRLRPDAAYREHLERIGAQLGTMLASGRAAETERRWALELQRANKELEAFSYSIAHDLQAPLRAIDGFSAALVEDYGSRLEPGAMEHLQRVRAAARRMAELIGDLLELSRITMSPITRASVDVTEVARSVLRDLQGRDPSRHVTVDISDGLVARADPRLLRVLLENLLSNAWKFTSKADDARISVGAQGEEGAPAFFVRDNGAGFDLAHADRLFSPFQRFHKRSEFDGTGIGLATVQRIARRHHGRVWADSAPGKGATFFFRV